MSAEEPATEPLNAPLDPNAQAAEDAKKMLAELQGDGEAQPKETNGDHQEKSDGPLNEESTEKSNSERHDRREKREGGRGGRGGRGGHGASRGGRGGPKNFKNNIKSDLTTQEISSDPVAIRRQVEFYFSDSNLPMDKFLLGKVGGSQNNPVELSVIHSFKRMRHFQPFEAIVEALRDSEFLEVMDDNVSIRRKEPLPESLNDGPDPSAVKVFEDKAMPRSVYVKGFGEEVPSTQFDIEAFFAPYGPTNAIRLRRTDTKLFKGSVFVEFESEELAQKFLSLEPKPKYKGKDLQIMSKKDYCEKKVEDIKAGKIQPNSSRGQNQQDNHRSSRNGHSARKRDNEDDRDWRKRREEDRKTGFRDDKRRGGRDSRDRGRRDFKGRQQQTDNRGIPTVKTSVESDEKPKKDTGKADALAKARAAVEAEQQKEGQAAADNLESVKQEGGKDVKVEAVGVASDSVQADTEVAGKKRGREVDDTETEREVKKVDVKEE